jgi:hypothetical protein
MCRYADSSFGLSFHRQVESERRIEGILHNEGSFYYAPKGSGQREQSRVPLGALQASTRTALAAARMSITSEVINYPRRLLSFCKLLRFDPKIPPAGGMTSQKKNPRICLPHVRDTSACHRRLLSFCKHLPFDLKIPPAGGMTSQKIPYVLQTPSVRS